MPTITCEGPPIKDMEARRKMVKEITDAAHGAYGLPKSVIVVVIRENQPENVAVGGELIADRREPGAGKEG